MTEEPMYVFDHPHASFDRFPQLVRDLETEFGRDGLDAVVERFAEAELGEFVWDERIAERDLGDYESIDDDEFEGSHRVRDFEHLPRPISRCDLRRRPLLAEASQMMLVINDFDDLPSVSVYWLHACFGARRCDVSLAELGSVAGGFRCAGEEPRGGR